MFFKDFVKIIQETFIIQHSVWIHILTHLMWKKTIQTAASLYHCLKNFLLLFSKH